MRSKFFNRIRNNNILIIEIIIHYYRHVSFKPSSDVINIYIIYTQLYFILLATCAEDIFKSRTSLFTHTQQFAGWLIIIGWLALFVAWRRRAYTCRQTGTCACIQHHRRRCTQRTICDKKLSCHFYVLSDRR